MKLRTSLPAGICMFGLGLIAVLSSGIASRGQPATEPVKREGRYQLITHANVQIILWDTETGQCWARDTRGNLDWINLGTPVKRGADKLSGPEISKKEVKDQPIPGRTSPDGNRDRADVILPGDRLVIKVPHVLPDQPIKGVYRVEPSGEVPLGYSYGRIKVEGLSPRNAQTAIHDHLAKTIKDPLVSVTRFDPVVADHSLHELQKELSELRRTIDMLRKQIKRE